MAVAASAAGCGDHAPAVPVYAPTVKMLIFSDAHYFAPSLGTSGAAFQSYVEHDRKLIAESDAIFRVMVDNVAAEDPQVVLVSGDLTKDGELASHQAVAALLARMKAGGRKVFVVPGNHDIQNGNAVQYAGDTTSPVANISAADFATLYRDFGYADALARDPNSLSYVAELAPGLWLLAMDSCIYGDTRGSSGVDGRLSDATQAWIAARLDQAKRQGIRVLAMMHHGLIEHFASQSVVFPQYLIHDRAKIADLLANGGVHAVFTGHFHASDITKGSAGASARAIYDIETGSAVTHPCPYRIVDLASDVLAITTKHVTAIDYNLGDGKDFPAHALSALRLGLDFRLTDLLASPPYSMAEATAKDIAPWLADGLIAHYAGDEAISAEVQTKVQALASGATQAERFSGAMLQSIWTDLPPGDNSVTLDLAAK
jgi:3',5'-cyclic AMP phosphodiesterase CpdA